MIFILYFIIVLFATIIGATAGLGGGVIIKPLFDLVGIHTAEIIGIYSSVAVLTMCVVSIYKQYKKGIHVNLSIVFWISLGSFSGGVLGDEVFEKIVDILGSDSYVKAVQSILLLFILLLILYFTKKENNLLKYKIQSSFLIFDLGLVLGTVSVFLGIGGGPLNIAIFTMFFSIGMKDAVIYSLATIFFSQISKLGLFVFLSKEINIDINLFVLIIIAALLGGYIGTKINQSKDEKTIKSIYEYTIVLLIFISLFNVVRWFI